MSKFQTQAPEAGKESQVIEKSAPAHWASIWIAGDATEAERICRKYCVENGLCVTVTPTEYVYTGGAEAGVCVRLINYPRFPAEPSDINAKALDLARVLRVGLCQWSFLIETPTKSTWFTAREERENW